MQYMLMVYENEEWGDLPKAEQARIHRDCAAWHDELVKSGHARPGGLCLQPPSTAATVRRKNGKPVVTDGPFAETKEVIGGYEVIECQDLDEAIAIAQRLPSLRVGFSVEIRPAKSDEEIQRMMEG